MADKSSVTLHSHGFDPNFREEVSRLPGGENVSRCFLCAACTASCPVSFQMDPKPHQIMKMIHLGMRKEVLSSPTPWLCATCYTCTVRCPQGVKFTDIMISLRALAQREKMAKRREEVKLFLNNICLFGFSCICQWYDNIPLRNAIKKEKLRLETIPNIEQVRGIFERFMGEIE